MDLREDHETATKNNDFILKISPLVMFEQSTNLPKIPINKKLNFYTNFLEKFFSNFLLFLIDLNNLFFFKNEIILS